MRGKDVEIIGVNDVVNAHPAHLLKYDSVHGRYPDPVEADGDNLVVGGKRTPVLAERDPAKLPWKRLGARVAVESTGLFTKRDDAAKHLAAGAERVIITAPATDPDLTVVLGVNDDAYDPARHRIISTPRATNCLAPVAKVLHQSFGIERGLMVTIHSYTADQRLVDSPHKDLRRARAGAVSMIPTSTGAARAIGLVMPELKGKLDGYAMRVPTPDVSVVDLSVQLKSTTDADAINAAIREAAQGRLKGILEYMDEPLVSIDFVGNQHSSIFDAPSTRVIDGNFAKVVSWYDNEMGYATRVADLAVLLGR
jgi:glyceraldehyde 3-phosphate dehydrogenase